MERNHSRDGSQATVRQAGAIIIDGWLLKKRRKKMQGFARRWVTVYKSGLLAYSFGPGKPIRDQILLVHAAVSTSTGRKDIHIDSNNATFHLKCLTTEEFDQWMSVLRKFITSGQRRSFGLAPKNEQFGQAQSLVDDMGTTITDLETAFNSLQNEDTTHKKKGEKLNGNAGSVSFKNKIFRRSSSNGDSDSIKTQGSANGALNPRQKIQAALVALRTQQEYLSKSIQSLALMDSNPSRRPSPLPTTMEEDEGANHVSHYMPSASRASLRSSMNASFVSDGGTSEFFDAHDDAEEFIFDSPEGPSPANEKAESELMSGSRSSFESVSDVSTEGTRKDDDMDNSGSTAPTSEPRQSIQEDRPLPSHLIVRRTRLPCGPVGDEGSLFAVLKKNVGKDLASIALPVAFNEPLTMLQSGAQELEYEDLLQKAVEATDPVLRMCYVAAFAISGYAHTKLRTGRKNFTPMLGETFEDVRTQYIAEKVQHVPFVMAFHAQGEGWELYGTSSGKTKFWGKSLEIVPMGATHLVIGSDHYQWNKPSSFLRNLIIGTKYLEHTGKMIIENLETQARCVVDFKEGGMWAAPNHIHGTVSSPSGHVETHLEGRWDESVVRKEDSSHLHVLWRMHPFPPDAEEMYGFTQFGITLNEITDDIRDKLPPTDSRLRPDVRALENGDIDTAEEGKVRIEEMQRDRRRNGKDVTPRWFRREGEEWIYRGGYWEARAQDWKNTDVSPLW